jgi:RNA polymerase sigma factor (sigma-70 family)
LTDGLQKIFDDYGPALLLYARQWCVHPEDALQEALLELFRQKKSPDDPVAWLFRAVRFRAMNLSRAESRRRNYQQQAASQGEPWFVPDPAAGLEAEELRAALEELPMHEREIVIARIWGGLSFQQIATLVDCSSSAAHRRYIAALKVLQQRLEANPKASR